MKNSVAFDDKRLLGVLDGVDAKFIAEALEYYDLAEPAKMRKAPLYRKIAAIAACLILLSGAFPVVIRFVSGTIDFMAGWGGLNEYGSKYDRAIDAYPDDMPVDEIFADVSKGGWLVDDYSINSIGADIGIELWHEFYDNVQAGKPASLLSAIYYPEVTYNKLSEESPKTALPGIVLQEICYDGEVFTLKRRSYIPTYPDYDVVATEILRQYQYLTVSAPSDDANELHIVFSNDRAVMYNEYVELIKGVEGVSFDGTYGLSIYKSDFYPYYSSELTD